MWPGWRRSNIAHRPIRDMILQFSTLRQIHTNRKCATSTGEREEATAMHWWFWFIPRPLVIVFLSVGVSTNLFFEEVRFCCLKGVALRWLLQYSVRAIPTSLKSSYYRTCVIWNATVTVYAAMRSNRDNEIVEQVCNWLIRMLLVITISVVRTMVQI